MGEKVVMSLTLPSEFMLYKMMRACVAVKDVEGLWIYAPPPLTREVME